MDPIPSSISNPIARSNLQRITSLATRNARNPNVAPSSSNSDSRQLISGSPSDIHAGIQQTIRWETSDSFTVSTASRNPGVQANGEETTQRSIGNQEHDLLALAGDLQLSISEELRQQLSQSAKSLSEIPTETKNSNTVLDRIDYGDARIQAYLEFIRMYSKNPENLQEFLRQLDAFLTQGSSDSSPSLESIFSQFAQQSSSASQEIFRQSKNITISLQVEKAVSQMQTAASQNEKSIQSQTFNVRLDGGKVLLEEEFQQSDPLVLDLDGDGIELTDVQNGVLFPLTGTNTISQTAFVAGGDAFLALDRNSNGFIDNGLELFGDQHGAKNGIEELRKFDENTDGVINSQDSIFSKLLLFQDINTDGISQPHELRTMREEGIRALELTAQSVNQSVAGNRLDQIAHYRRFNGKSGIMGEVFLNFMA